MPRVEANGVSIEYEPFGEKGNTPLVLIAGNGAQMLFWESKFCEMLADAGFFVVRFDKRDSGLSDKFDALGVPDMGDFYRAAAEGREIAPPRSLSDMADDVAGLLDGLGIGRSFVCGASMGGAIAQLFAFRHPQCTAALVSIISSDENPGNPQIDPGALDAVTANPLNGRPAHIEAACEMWRSLWSSGFPFKEGRARRYAEACCDRSFCPTGRFARMRLWLPAGIAEGGLPSSRCLRSLFRGPLILCSRSTRGVSAARSVPGAELLLVGGMAHDTPVGVLRRVVGAICDLRPRARLG